MANRKNSVTPWYVALSNAKRDGGYTNRQMAFACGVHSRTYERWVSGETLLPVRITDETRQLVLSEIPLRGVDALREAGRNRYRKVSRSRKDKRPANLTEFSVFKG